MRGKEKLATKLEAGGRNISGSTAVVPLPALIPGRNIYSRHETVGDEHTLHSVLRLQSVSTSTATTDFAAGRNRSPHESSLHGGVTVESSHTVR